MRLSEAIRLGSLTVEKPRVCDIEACAITMALNAVGNKAVDLARYAAIETEWPWVSGLGEIQCPWCSDGFKIGGVHGRAYCTSILYHTFDTHVMQQEITIEQLADWISTIEPPEPKPMASEEFDRGLAITRCHGE